MAQPQPLRVAMVVTFLSVAAFAHFARHLVVRHYEVISVTVIAIGIVCTSLIASLNQTEESPYSRYWGVFSAAVFTTTVIYGFTRLSAFATVSCLATFNAATAIWFAKDYGGDVKVMQRLIVHLVCINFICFSLYRIITLRERKLFLRGKRQRSINELKRARDKAEEASRAKSAFLANMSHEILGRRLYASSVRSRCSSVLIRRATSDSCRCGASGSGWPAADPERNPRLRKAGRQERIASPGADGFASRVPACGADFPGQRHGQGYCAAVRCLRLFR